MRVRVPHPIRACVMLAVAFFSLAGISHNDWHFSDVCIGLAIWFAALAITYIVPIIFGDS